VRRPGPFAPVLLCSEMFCASSAPLHRSDTVQMHSARLTAQPLLTQALCRRPG